MARVAVAYRLPRKISNITGLASWYRSDAVNQTNASSVVAVQDAGSRKYALSTTVSPTYTTSAINSLGACTFNGTTQFFRNNSFSTAASGSGQALSVIVCVKSTALAGSDTIWALGSAGTPFYQFRVNAGATAYESRHRDDASTLISSSSAPAANTSTRVISTVFAGATEQIYMEGTAAGAALDTSTLGACTYTTFTIGCIDLGGTSSFFTGHVAEALFFTASLSTADRQTTERYLGQKWGVTVA